MNEMDLADRRRRVEKVLEVEAAEWELTIEKSLESYRDDATSRMILAKRLARRHVHAAKLFLVFTEKSAAEECFPIKEL